MNAARLLGSFLRVPTKVHPIRSSLNSCYRYRFFHTSSVRMEELKENPFYGKYAERLKKMQQENPEDFTSKVNAIADAHKKELEQKKKDVEEANKDKESTQVKPKVLDDFMKMDLIKDKSPEEIEMIWVEYHKGKNYVFAVIPKDEYEEIMHKAKQYGTFIYPVPRGEGYEFFLQQFSANMINFTPLIQYQTHKENAPPCFTITHYEDIRESKGIVLMHGEPDTQVLSIHEAQLLAMQVKMYYGLQSGLKFNLVRLFNTSPDTFRYMDLIKEFHNWKKDLALSKEDRESKKPLEKRE